LSYCIYSTSVAIYISDSSVVANCRVRCLFFLTDDHVDPLKDIWTCNMHTCTCTLILVI